MSDKTFQDPHGDEPLDDMPVPGQDAYGGPMGATTATPAMVQRKPRTTKRFLWVALPVVAIGAFLFVASRGHRGDASTTVTKVARSDSVVNAPLETGPAASVAPIKADSTATANSNTQVIEPVSPVPASPVVSGSPIVSQGAAGTIDPYNGSTARPGTQALPGNSVANGGVSVNGSNGPLPESASPVPDIGGGNSAVAAANAADMARQAQATHDAQVAARKAAIVAEETRLREKPTLVVKADQSGAASAAPSRFAVALPDAGPMVGGSGSTTMAAADATALAAHILPGTRVHAVTISQYRSDTQGGGTIEVRLTEPLRSNGQILLPAGTRAFGQVSASSPQPGVGARASAVFDVFVTPQNQVIRGLQGKAVDPKTLATSVSATSDYHYTQRFGRALLSGGLDYLLTQNSTQPISAFQQPSPRDQAIADERRRFGTIINGNVGDENSFTASVRIDPGTLILIQFGI